jgi:hypothetical protein
MKSKFGIAALIGFACILEMFMPARALGADYSVYEVYRAIDLGESDRPPPKEIFVNMGSNQGVKKGSVLDVYRKVVSFDILSEKVGGEHMIPVGRIKVIHTDEKTAIARVDRYVSLEQEVSLLPQTVMIGDLVRLAR